MLLEAALQAVFPRCCPLCDRPQPSPAEPTPCHRCLEAFEINIGRRCAVCDLPLVLAASCVRCSERPPTYSRMRTPYLYGGGLAELIQKSKFSGHERLCQSLGELLLADSESCALVQGCDVIMAVPLTRRRRLARGYNQSAVIARHLAKSLKVPVSYGLRRQRMGPPQSSLGARQRWQNAAAAFRVNTPLAGRVLLVDDVVTSGATAHHAAQCIRLAGASEVWVVAVARRLEAGSMEHI